MGTGDAALFQAMCGRYCEPSSLAIATVIEAFGSYLKYLSKKCSHMKIGLLGSMEPRI